MSKQIAFNATLERRIMQYNDIVPAKFKSRPNRFIAIVELDGKELSVHVKNTGRCRELLIPGCTVYLDKADNPARKTPYDLVAVEKDKKVINIDSQAPNQVVKEWLLGLSAFDRVQPEYTYGNSRIDFGSKQRVFFGHLLHFCNSFVRGSFCKQCDINR